MAVRAVRLVPLQPAQGLDGADRPGSRRRWRSCFVFLWFLAALLFRLRFQFSIRSLLLLTVVVAIPCSWLAVEREQARKQREAVEAIEKLGGWVAYDYHSRCLGDPG